MSAYEDAIKAGGVAVAETPYEKALKQGGVPYSPGFIEKTGESVKKAGGFLTDYYNWLTQHEIEAPKGSVMAALPGDVMGAQAPTVDTSNMYDWETRVLPESISRAAVTVPQFPYHVGKGIGDVIQKRGIEGQPAINPETGQPSTAGRVLDTLAGVGEEGAKNILGLAHFQGDPFGVFGLEKAQEVWRKDPGSALLAVAPVLAGGIRAAAGMRAKPTAAPRAEPPAAEIPRPAPPPPPPGPVPTAEGVKVAPPVLKPTEAPVEAPVVPEAVVPPVPTPKWKEIGKEPTPEKGLFPGQDQFRLTSPAADTPIGGLIPDQGEQALIPGTEKAYSDVGMREKPPAVVPDEQIVSQIDSLRSILPDFEQGKKIWSQDSREVIGSKPNMYPPWFKDVFPNDSASRVMETIDKWKESGDASLTKRENRIMASVKDLAQNSADRGVDIGQEHYQDMMPVGRGILGDESGSLDVTFLRPVYKAGDELATAYKRPPEFTESKKIVGQYTGAIQMIDHELAKVARDINAKLPKERQEAITNYMQAGGDESLLQQRVAGSKPAYKKGYEDALKLSPEEKSLAQQFRNRMDAVWKQANDAGILDAYVENYVRGEWKKSNKALKIFLAQVDSGLLRTNPREAMHKVWQAYYEGEQAGYVPSNKAIGYQMIAMERSLRMAVEARKALKDLMSSKEKDGRPTVAVGGAGSFMGDAVEGKEPPAYFIKPNVLPEGVRDYKYLDHPALRKWKWVGSDTEGKPIFLQGDMWIHPQAFGRINALIGRSKIRDFTVPERVPVIGGTQPGKAALQAGAFVKGTILVGPFHLAHVGEHAVFHKVNPFNTREIDFVKRPLLKEGVEHGLMLYSRNAIQEFGEGIATGGAWKYAPGVGDALARFQKFTFEDIIPRLKAEMFEHAVERAEKWYAKDIESGKLTRDQLLENAANQANAAFGEQNYRYMGRNPTLQDALRIATLAPDFLESRMKFFGQALRPYGREQRHALIRGAIIMGATAQIINMTVGDHKWHWDRPFSIIIGDREFTPRSVVGDMMHLLKDPRNFMYFRLNPLWGRPLAEIATGRDKNGRKVDAQQMLRDTLDSWVPIPGQEFVKRNQTDSFLSQAIHTVLQSSGVSNYPYRSDAEKLVMENMPRVDRPRSKIQREINDVKAKTIKLKRAGKTWDQFPSSLKQKLDKLPDSVIVEINREVNMTNLQSNFKHISAESALEVWKVATPEEKKSLEDEYNTKLINYSKKLSPEEYEAFKEMVRKAEQ